MMSRLEFNIKYYIKYNVMNTVSVMTSDTKGWRHELILLFRTV